MTFKIETVKWEWPEAVLSKNIYRDDEFVRSHSYEEAIEATKWLLEQPKGLTYTISVHRDNEYFTYYRHTMPCLGGLVKYRADHGDRYFMNPYHPRDIRVRFPDGDIVLIGIYKQGMEALTKTPYGEFVLSDESPWISAIGSKKNVIIKDNHFILTDMNTDPTVLYSLWRLGGIAYPGTITMHPKAHILNTKTSMADPRRLTQQNPIRISGGTWAEGYGYTRPYNESIFKTKLPHELKDFHKLGSYPSAPHTNQYFTDTMAKVFKARAPYNEKVLLEAWDYFKGESL